MSNFEHTRILDQCQLDQISSEGVAGKFAQTEIILRMPSVVSVVGLSRATIYRLISVGDFPKPVKLGRHARGWLQSAIQSWISQRAGRQWV